MKKLLVLLLVIVLAVSMLAGCKSSPQPSPSGSESPSGSASPSASASPSGSSSPSSSASASLSGSPSMSAGSAKTGLGIVTSLAKSADASAEKDGVAEVDSTVVAVTIDKDGKITACAIDAVQAKINFDEKGKLLTPADTEIKTKDELGDEYGMKEASGIGKEWFEQAAAFADFVRGMTVDEVKNIKVDEKNYATEPDLKASVTISIGSFVECIEKAVTNAKEGGAAESDTLGLGIVSSMSKSTAATKDAEGLAQVSSTYVAMTKDAGGKISSCVIDASQSSIGFTQQGKITTDLSMQPLTKDEMKEAYGLKEASGIGKEWFEQAEAFAQYVTGKTPQEVAGIAVDEKGYAVAADIKSSVTISVADFKAAIEKASGTPDKPGA